MEKKIVLFGIVVEFDELEKEISTLRDPQMNELLKICTWWLWNIRYKDYYNKCTDKVVEIMHGIIQNLSLEFKIGYIKWMIQQMIDYGDSINTNALKIINAYVYKYVIDGIRYNTFKEVTDAFKKMNDKDKNRLTKHAIQGLIESNFEYEVLAESLSPEFYDPLALILDYLERSVTTDNTYQKTKFSDIYVERVIE